MVIQELDSEDFQKRKRSKDQGRDMDAQEEVHSISENVCTGHLIEVEEEKLTSKAGKEL